MPEIQFDTLDAIPEGLRENASQKDGKFTINVVLKSKLDEFRDNNTALSQQRDDLKTSVAALQKIVGDDPTTFATNYEEMRKTAQQVADGKLKGTEAIETEVNNRVASMKADYERQIQTVGVEARTWKEKAEASETKFRRSLIDRGVTNAVLAEASGALPGALADILTRAYGVFVVDDKGDLTAKNGEATIYGSDGTTPMSPSEWLDKLKETAPFFFKNSNGGSAHGANDKLPGGISGEDFAKLTGAQKLALARQAGTRR